MRTFSLSEAKRRLSEIVERASYGERIGIVREGKLVAIIVPARPENSLKDIFEDIESIRQHTTRAEGFQVEATD
jgi:prevent-host-death family protein